MTGAGITVPIARRADRHRRRTSRAASRRGLVGKTRAPRVEFRTGSIPTQNVIAETRGGDPNKVIVVGAHLDSVGAGPGINDNGSGSAAILEIAEQLRGVFPKNKIRFIWFSAEESGLLGSEAYVDSLPQSERRKIAAMLNFDMIGSPNFVNFVYDGDLSDSPPIDADVFAPEARPFSATIEKIFLDYFKSQRIPNEPTASTVARTMARSSPPGDPGRWPVHRRRGRQDTGAGHDLRRHGRRSVRPVLPPRLRRLLQQLATGRWTSTPTPPRTR